MLTLLSPALGTAAGLKPALTVLLPRREGLEEGDVGASRNAFH